MALAVDTTDPEFPVGVVTDEVLSIQMILKRKQGFDEAAATGAKWKILRACPLADGTGQGRIDRKILREQLASVVDDVLRHHQEPLAVAST
ncbi:hypothetical protein GN244_ATG17700 [Phytophthora infestans]|uniref:Uncharacterized protein n=1 Tax=Phytophthora infestans TaxID=4787 RepID=A0A833S151_PHYIN|nr:hypothetical protein GN244_ATG18564 [Phytophthora infestans]KAF4030526.1 hypothetical protein GN244_ATG17700 [Phytophthora infestans]